MPRAETARSLSRGCARAGGGRRRAARARAAAPSAAGAAHRGARPRGGSAGVRRGPAPAPRAPSAVS